MSVRTASTIIGFISFSFTLATLLRVFWENVMTIWKANDEVHDLLPSLKQALYEERDHLRRVRRRCRGYYEDGAMDLLYSGVKGMIRDFKRLEAPFLVPARDGDEKAAYALDAEEPRDYYNTNYRHITLRERFIWVRERGGFIELSESLSRVQTRRIARQTTDIGM